MAHFLAECNLSNEIETYNCSELLVIHCTHSQFPFSILCLRYKSILGALEGNNCTPYNPDNNKKVVI